MPKIFSNLTRNKPSLVLVLISFLFVFNSCKTTEVVPAYSPQYTKVENLAKLKVGMTKSSVLSQLENVYPHEILNGTGNCEIHEYFYVKPKRSSKNITGIFKREELTTGDPKYSGESSACIVYKDNKLSVVYSNASIDEVAQLLNAQNSIEEQCQNELIVPKGCTDPKSLNFDPDALEDDGSCEYCECGMVPNPDYNDNRPISDCNTKCISEDLVDENGNVIRKTNSEEEKCDKCDLIDALKNSDAKVTINLNSRKSKKNSIKINNEDFKLASKFSDRFSKAKTKKKNTKKPKVKSKTKPVSNPSEIQVIKVY